MSTSRRVRLRVLAHASLDRSAELAAALKQQLNSHGNAEVEQRGRYWKIQEYLEFAVELTRSGGASPSAADVRARQPAGWSDDVWNYQFGGREFLLPEIRWAWIWTDDE